MAERIAMCHSGGKDSLMSLYELRCDDRYEVDVLVTTVTEGYDRISMHGVRRTLLHQQAESLGVPLEEVTIPPRASNEIYEHSMAEVLMQIRETGIQKVAFGDIFLEDLRAYRERQLDALGMECLFPVWQRQTDELASTFIDLGFRAITTCVDPKRLDESFVGRMIDREFLDDLPAGIDPCGENGEFHSFVFDGPILEWPIDVTRGEVVCRDSFFYCDVV